MGRISGLGDFIPNYIFSAEFKSWHPLHSLRNNRPCGMEGLGEGIGFADPLLGRDLEVCSALGPPFCAGESLRNTAFGDYSLKDLITRCCYVPTRLRTVCWCISLSSELLQHHISDWTLISLLQGYESQR